MSGGGRVDDDARIVDWGRRTVRMEADAVAALSGRIGDSFARAVRILLSARGKVVITGVGKSGLIGKKIAATMTSTGTPAIFLHAADAVHGDLGMLGRDDVLLAISNSGETEEILRLIPAVRRLGVPLVAMAGRTGSNLAKAADVFLDIAVDQEACPLGLAPTSSTAATLAMGDALAVALLEARGFREEDFALLHPGGKLGRRWLRVAELMHTGDRMPSVADDALLKEVIYEISSKGLGMTVVLDSRGGLSGIVTDGDLRRMFGAGIDFYGTPVGRVMTRNPKTVAQDALAEQALRIMEEHSITSLVVVDDNPAPVGVIHLHDLLKAGVV